MKKPSVVVVIIILVGAFVLYVPAETSGQTGNGQRLGFWLQEGNIMAKYSAPTFFKAMFLTPPYPTSVEVMIFAIQQDQASNNGCSASTPYVKQSISYWGQVAQLANAYPNVRLIYEISFTPNAPPYDVTCFNTMVQAFAQYPSIYGMGVEGEYTKVSDGMTEAIMQTAMNDVTATGKQFVNYYAPVPIPAGGYDITHTNFPGGDSGGYDQVGTLQDADSQTIGIDSGYYANYQFPGTVTCPIGATAITSSTAGWNQCVVSTELSTAVSFSPASARQFLEVDVGFSSSGSFTGVSGQTTNQLWDNPTLRNWVWTDPNYQPNFLLSTSPSTTTSTTIVSSTTPGTTTTTSTSRTSTTSTSATSSSSSSTTTTTTSSSPTTATTSSSTTATSTSTSRTSTTSTSTSTTTTSSGTTTTRTSTTTTSSSTSTTSTPASYILSTYVTCPTGISSCGSASPVGSSSYVSGTTLTLTANPYGGYVFGSWSICTSSCQQYSANPLSLTLVANTQATAIFASGSTTTTTTTSTSTVTTSSTETTTTTTTTTSTSSSATTTTSATTTNSASSSSSQTTSPSATTTISTSGAKPAYTLSIVGACTLSGAGSYADGYTATVEFMGVCERSQGSGIRVISWSLDGGTNNTVETTATSGISVVMNASHTVRLHSVPQYQLSLDYGAQASMLSVTPPSIPGDDYWYDSGTSVSFIGGVELARFTVTGWALDSLGAVSVSGAPFFSSTPFAMTEPHSLTVVLTPASGSSCGSPSCTSAPVFDVTIRANENIAAGVWVDGASFPQSVTFSWPAGSIHNITATRSEVGLSVRKYFSHWSGDSTSQSPTIMLIVNRSGYLAAEYLSQYLVSLAFTDAGGTPLTPQAVSLTGPAGVQKLGSNLSIWVIGGDIYKLTSVSWLDSNVVIDNASKFSANWPGTLTFRLAVYPQVVKATDVYGLPLQGARVNVTTSNGIGFSVIADAQGIARFIVPFGIYSATVSYMGVTEQIVPNNLGAHNYTVTFLLSYPLFATIGAVSAIACVFVFRRLRKRPDFQSVYFFDSA